MARATVVGSGAAGGLAAMVLAANNYDVVVFEKGPRLADPARPSERLDSSLSSDELAGPIRRVEYPDALAEPREFVHRTLGHTVYGEVNSLPSLVGGGTVHWAAKTPRYWDIDFKKLSMLGPIEGADIADWPFDYAELAPYYEQVESLLGVQGDVDSLPLIPTLAHAPRRRQFDMPPGAPQHSSVTLAAGARRLGLEPFPIPMAINSRSRSGRPACTNCGFCDGYACASASRGDALVALSKAIECGAELRSDCQVVEVTHTGTTATGTSYIDSVGNRHWEPADIIVVAASAVESCRIALLSRLPDPHGLVGRGLMFHACSVAYGLFPSEPIITDRGRHFTHAIDDFADPSYPGAVGMANSRGLPYLRGGIAELGFKPMGPIQEADVYRRLLNRWDVSGDAWSIAFNALMQSRLLGRHMTGVMMHGEDLAQFDNRVVLSRLCDYNNVPVPRITYAPHTHELVAQDFYIPLMRAILDECGAVVSAGGPEFRTSVGGIGGPVPTDHHVMGGLRMSESPRHGSVDEFGRYWRMPNLFFLDGSVFPTSGAHNPTLTIMAVALRALTHIVGRSASAPKERWDAEI